MWRGHVIMNIVFFKFVTERRIVNIKRNIQKPRVDEMRIKVSLEVDENADVGQYPDA